MINNIYILYLYFETEIGKKNLSYFIKKGYINDAKYQYLFIINGHKCSIDIPKQENINITTRDNLGYDFGGWAHGLRVLDFPNKMLESDRIIFINSTVKGPYISNNKIWIDEFVNMITDNTKLAGISINCHNGGSLEPAKKEFKIYKDSCPHVQSMLLVTDKIGLNIGIEFNVFDGIDMPKELIIIKKEIGYSARILENGYNINCILPKYKDKNYLDHANHNINNNQWSFGNSFNEGTYFGKSINPYEAIFVKTNQNINYAFIDFQNADLDIDINIIYSYYGNAEKTIDVYDKISHYRSIREILNMNTTVTLGDPCPGQKKELILILSKETKYYQYTIQEFCNKFIKCKSIDIGAG